MADSKTFKFEPDIPLKVTFSFDDFREKEWEDGKSYGYGVRSDGELGYINCTQRLHDLLQKIGVGKGVSVTITKRAIVLESGKPGFGFDVQKNGKSHTTYEAAETPQNAPESTETPSTHIGIPELGAQMRGCFQEAENIVGEFSTGNPDVRTEVTGRVAVSLFIAFHKINHQ
uniref:Uncharacterized protein n=1 Tax=viral metagenome TaxID=1070528 RepID=A0A6M3LSR6_9ZZZZ